MTIRTIAGLKTVMPIGVTGGISAQDMHDLIDTLESRTIGAVAQAPNVRTAATYTIALADLGGIVAFTGAAAITVTLPDTLPAGFRCTVAQIGAGQITFAPGGAATIVSVQTLRKTALLGSGADVWVYENTTGTAAKYWLAGDLAA